MVNGSIASLPSGTTQTAKLQLIGTNGADVAEQDSQIRSFQSSGGAASTNTALAFDIHDVEMMRLDGLSSSLLIGTTTDDGSNKLQVNGGIAAVLPTSSAGLPSGSMWNNGGVVNIVP